MSIHNYSYASCEIQLNSNVLNIATSAPVPCNSVIVRPTPMLSFCFCDISATGIERTTEQRFNFYEENLHIYRNFTQNVGYRYRNWQLLSTAACTLFSYISIKVKNPLIFLCHEYTKSIFNESFTVMKKKRKDNSVYS